MRYRVAVLMLLMLLAVLPVMDVLAAPAPDPSAILDIGPPPKGMTAEEYRNRYIKYLFMLCGYDARHAPEVKKLPSVVNSKVPWLWLGKNLRVTPEKEDSRLRLTFRAGNRAEQVAILNAVLRAYLREVKDERIHFHENILRRDEKYIIELEKRIESGQHRESTESYWKEINDLRTIRIPAAHAEIARYKKIAVIKWAK